MTLASRDRIQDPEFIERMLRRTGGTEVDILGRVTYGHVRSTRGGQAVPPGFEERPGGSDDVLVIARGVLPEGGERVKVGTALDVDGEPMQVLDHQLIEDGELMAIMPGSWQHEVEVYERDRSGTDTRGHQEGGPVEVGQTVCDLRSRGGEIRGEDAGDFAVSRWQGRLPPDADFVRTGHVLKVVGGTAPVEHLEVTNVGDKTPRWRIPFTAREMEESL